MRGLGIAAAALAMVVAASFLAARGCVDDRETPPRTERAEGAAGDGASASRDEDVHRIPRARAARPPAGAEEPGRDAEDEATCRLSVRVLADPERTPLAGARVVVLHQPGEPSAITDADGYAVLDVRRGVRTGRVECPGRTTTGFAEDCRADVATLEIALSPGARLQGRVVDAGSGRPLSGVNVGLFSGGFLDGTYWALADEPFAELVSDDAGAFGIDGLAPAGVMTIRSTMPGRARHHESLRLAGPGVLRVELAMEPGGSVSGVVRAADGTAVRGVCVTVGAAVSSSGWVAGRAPFHATTADDGAYRVEGLDLDGIYVVECSPTTFAAAAATDVRPTASRPEVRCDLTFAPTGVLRVELDETWASEDAVRVVRVLPGAIDSELCWLADGTPCEMTPQRLRLELDANDGHPPIVREVRVESGAETVVRFERPPVHRLAGRAVGTDGRPRAGVRLTVMRGPADARESWSFDTADDGSFEFEAVAPGTCTVEAEFGGDAPAVLQRVVVPCDPLLFVEPAPTSLRFRLPDGIRGVFVRWAIEAPVPDADGVVRWESWTSGTGDADGEPFEEGSPDWTGPTRFRVSVPGFLPFERIVDVEPGSRHDVVAGPLVPCPTLRGRVVDGQGRPVADADVSIDGDDPFDELRARVETDDDGKFADLSLPPGPATVLVEAKGFADRRVELPGPPAAPIEIFLSRPGRLVVRARDGAGVPAAGREVWVVESSGRAVEFWPGARTDHRGRFDRAAPPGRLRVSVGGGETVEAEVKEQETTTIDVVVP